jgi:transcription antitermination factor NusG
MNTTSKGNCLSEGSEALPPSIATGKHNTLHMETNTQTSQWYAVHTVARHEKRVRDHIKSRNIECFLPLYEVIHRWKNGCRAKVELPLFPSYLFVEIDLLDRVRILDVPGVLSLVGAGPYPQPLPEGEVEALRAGLHLRNPEPHPYLTAGQKVRITSGPLATLTGVLLRHKDRLRVVLSVETLMRGVAVEVPIDDIETLD